MNMLKKIYYVFDKRQKVRAGILFLIIMVGTLLELVGVSAILPVINLAMEPDSIYETGYLKSIYDFLNLNSVNTFLVVLCVALIIIYIVKNAYRIFMIFMKNNYVYNNQRRISTKLMNYYIHKNYLYHVNHNTTEIVRNISSDVLMFISAVSAIIQLLIEISVCIALFMLLCVTDIMMTMMAAIAGIAFLFFFMKISKRKIARYGEIYRQYNVEMNKTLYQVLHGIKEVKVIEAEEYFEKRYDYQFSKSVKYTKKYQLLSALPQPVMEATLIGGMLLMVVIKMLTGTDMSTLVSTLSVFAVAAFRILPSFNRISAQLTTLVYNKPAVEAVYEAVKAMRNDTEESKKSEGNKSEYVFEKQIELNDISFSYPNREGYVIEDSSLIIKKNESIAFVGRSGAGKTTLADILLMVLAPQKGAVLCDGQDVSNNLSAWHSKIGYIPQTIFLMDDTIRNNIAFGISESDISDEKIWGALEQAQLKEFVLDLPQGLDTLVGEQGVRFSGGQRQRIGIARALYRNPEILVLDEATSALDCETETAVMEAISALAGKKTLVIIAHRLSTIENCDVVYEINDGSVIIKKRKE